MHGFIMLDLAISMALVYLMVSLFCSTIQEAIASWRGWRGKTLYEGIEILLSGQGQKTAQNPLGFLSKIFPKKKNNTINSIDANSESIKKLVTNVLNHPLTSGQGLNERFPSYLPSQQLARVLLRSIQEIDSNNQGDKYDFRETISSLPNSQLKETLLILADEAEDDYDDFIANVEQWYDNFMDRVSGWYKRRAQLISFLIGITVAVSMNIDSIEIFKELWREPILRASIVSTAQNQNTSASIDTNEIKRVKKNLDSLHLPIGWPASQLNTQTQDQETKNIIFKYISMFIGWLITASAASLGAPFWFNLLDKLLSIRGSGKRPEARTKTVTVPPIKNKKNALDINAKQINEDLKFEQSLMDDDIVDIQVVLGIKPEERTGEINETTRKIIRRTQAAYGEPATGILNSKFVHRVLQRS